MARTQVLSDTSRVTAKKLKDIETVQTLLQLNHKTNGAEQVLHIHLKESLRLVLFSSRSYAFIPKTLDMKDNGNYWHGY